MTSCAEGFRVVRRSVIWRRVTERARLAAPPSDQEREWLLDQVGDRAEELGAPRAVERAVVAGERQYHRRLDGGLAVQRDDTIRDTADGENRRLRRIDDRVEGIDAVHTEVADREGPALDVGRPQLAGLGAAHHLLAARGE